MSTTRISRTHAVTQLISRRGSSLYRYTSKTEVVIHRVMPLCRYFLLVDRDH